MNEIIFSYVWNDPHIKEKLLFNIIFLLMQFKLHIFQNLIMSSTATPFVYFKGL